MSGLFGEVGFKIGAAAAKLAGVSRVFNAPTVPNAGTAVVVINGSVGTAFPVVINNNTPPIVGLFNGLQINAGAGITDFPFLVQGGLTGTSTFLSISGRGDGSAGWNTSGVPVLSWNNQGVLTNNGNLQVNNPAGNTLALNVGQNIGVSIENIAAGAPGLRVYEAASATVLQLTVGAINGPPGLCLGTSTLYAIGTGTHYPYLQLAGVGGILGTTTAGFTLMGGGLYHNGTNYIYGQAGTGVIASLGTGTFQVQAVNTSGTAAGTATPFTVLSVSGSATQGVVTLGTTTTLPWGGGAAIPSVIQFDQAAGIMANGGQGMYFLDGGYYNGTNYQFAGTGGGTSTFGLTTMYLGTLAHYWGGVGTYTQQATVTQVFKQGGTIGPTIQSYGPNAAVLVDCTPDTGTFTGTWGGLVAAPAGTVAYWSRQGNNVMLLVPYGTGSKSGAAGIVTFAMPAVGAHGPPLPTRPVICGVPVCINGATTSVGNVIVNSANATLTFQGLGGINFTGTANLSIGITGDFTCIPYPIAP